MRPETLKHLWDIQQAGHLVLQFTEGKTLEEYDSDLMLRSAVERQFTIVGEALNRLRKVDPLVTISDIRPIIAFRNVLVHGYDIVENSKVWDAVDQSLPALIGGSGRAACQNGRIAFRRRMS